MSDQGGHKESLAHAGVRLGSHVVSSLAPQFLALLLINACVLGILFWFVDTRARYTSGLIDQLMKACLRTVNQ